MGSDEAVRMVIKALGDLGIPHMIVGSLSSNAWGIARSTVNADLVIETDEKIAELSTHIETVFRAEPQLGFESVQLTTKYLYYHRDTDFRLEVFVLSDDEHDRMRFSRRVTIEDRGLKLTMPTPEDVIVQKLRWGRIKDIEDIKPIIQLRNASLDWPYIRQWCERHGSTARLNAAIAEAGVD